MHSQGIFLGFVDLLSQVDQFTGLTHAVNVEKLLIHCIIAPYEFPSLPFEIVSILLFIVAELVVQTCVFPV